MSLTVLTALTRLGVDPWLEAARLADLSKEAALRALRDHSQAARRRLEGRGRGGHRRASAAVAASAQAVPAGRPRSIGDRMKLGLAPGWLG
jgi:hypothetical protein